MSNSAGLIAYIVGAIAVALALWAAGADDRLINERIGAIFGLILFFPAILWLRGLFASWRGKE